MPDSFVPSPAYPNYAGFLSNLIGGLPGDYRSAQQQQQQIDSASVLKKAIADAQNPSPLLGGGSPQPAPAPAPAPQTDLPPASAAAGRTTTAPAAQPAISGSEGLPSLSDILSSVPDPNKRQNATTLLSKKLGIDPSASLSADQMAYVQRIVTANKMSGPNMGAGQLADAVRGQLIDSGQASRASASPAPPLRLPDTATVGRSTAQVQADGAAGNVDLAARGGLSGGTLTQAQALALRDANTDPNTPVVNAPPRASAGATLPPAAEAVWNRMVPSAGSVESGGKQTGPDGSILTSPKGAKGIAQVMPGTGPEAARLAGLPWDPVLFNGTGPEAEKYSLALGKAYFSQQYNAFGSPDLAAAAYNAGPGRVLSAQGKASRQGGSWQDYLPAETKAYVANVTGGGGPAAPQGNRSIGSQPNLPPGAANLEQGVDMYNREIARFASLPGNAGQGQAQVLREERDRLIASSEPMSVGATTSLIDRRTAQPVYQGPFATGGGMSPEALDNAAMTSLKTGQDPKNLGRGAQGAQNLIAIQNRKAEIMAENGWSTDDVAAMQQKFKAQQGVLKEFESGKDSRSVGSYNTLVSHLETFRAAIAALGNGDTRAFNWFRQEWNRQTGNPAPTNFEGVKELVGDEIIKAATGGAGALGDREGIKKTLDAVSSPQALNSMVDQYRDLSIGQLKTFRRRYEFGTGRKDFDEMLAPETRAYFGDGGTSPGGAAPATGGQGATSAAGAAPAQPVRITKEQYDALPRGALFIAADDPTQTPRTKP